MAINKMFIMVPVMLLARKLDGEDPLTVYWLRLAYAGVQSLCLLLVFYTYYKAHQASLAYSNYTVYVPPAPLPFADPNAKKKYVQMTYGTQVINVARSLLGSILFGLVITIGLHYFKNVVMGLAVQTIMAPLNLIENPLVQALVWKGRIQPEDKIFDEKIRDELTPEDQVEDEQGHVVNFTTASTASTSRGNNTNTGDTIATSSASTMEEILLDAWDAGTKADLGQLMSAINEKNVNDQTQELGWTPLMVLAGLGVPGTGSAIRQVRDGLGGDPTIVDAEGWNALHWAAFHGSLEGAKALLKSSSPSTKSSLLMAPDKEGKTPLDQAKEEGNAEVANLLEEELQTILKRPNGNIDDEAATTPKSDNTSSPADGLRKRK